MSALLALTGCLTLIGPSIRRRWHTPLAVARPFVVALSLPAALFLLEWPYNTSLFSIDAEHMRLNLWLVGAGVLAVWFVLQRRNGSLLFCLAACLVGGLANYFLCLFKGQTILPADVLAISTAAEVSGGYDFAPLRQRRGRPVRLSAHRGGAGASPLATPRQDQGGREPDQQASPSRRAWSTGTRRTTSTRTTASTWTCGPRATRTRASAPSPASCSACRRSRPSLPPATTRSRPRSCRPPSPAHGTQSESRPGPRVAPGGPCRRHHPGRRRGSQRHRHHERVVQRPVDLPEGIEGYDGVCRPVAPSTGRYGRGRAVHQRPRRRHLQQRVRVPDRLRPSAAWAAGCTPTCSTTLRTCPSRCPRYFCRRRATAPPPSTRPRPRATGAVTWSTGNLVLTTS